MIARVGVRSGRSGLVKEGRHKHSGPLGGRPTPMELLVRPWVATTTRELPVITPPAEEFPEAFIEWGGSSDFKFGDTFREKALEGLGFSVDDPDTPDRERLTFGEEGRQFEDFRIEMVDDPTQYVVVRAAKRIGFRGPNGEQWTFIFDNGYIPGTEEGSGQEPPAPPALEDIV